MNEELQRAILEALLERYPLAIEEEEVRLKLHSRFPNEVTEEGWHLENPDIFVQESYDLEGKGFLERQDGEIGYLVGWMKLTAKGKRFLQGDGDTAEHIVVTVKFDEENIRTLLDYMTSRTSLSDQEQHTIREKLSKLPGKALEKVFDKLLDKAMDPNVVTEIMRNLPF